MNWLQKQLAKATGYIDEKRLEQELNKYDEFMKYRLDTTIEDMPNKYEKYFKVTYYIRAKTYTANSVDVQLIVESVKVELDKNCFPIYN